MSWAPRALVVTLAVAIAGCGSTAEIDRGGVVLGSTLTVYSLLPDDPALAATAQDIIDGEKVALEQAGGRAGVYLVNYNTLRFERDSAQIADTTRKALRDPAVIAVIGDLDSRSARVSIPLLNAAGLLHLSPGATYTGFLAPGPGIEPGEPDRWRPSGHETFFPVAPTDVVQARALVAAAGAGRVAVEAEGSDQATALAATLAELLGDRLASDTADASAVIYAGSDPANADGVVEALRREAPKARVILPESLLRTDLPTRLSRAARQRAVFLASVPPPEADAGFAAAFERAFDRSPGPYAKVGHDAMRGVLAAIEKAGPDAGRRSAVIAAYVATKPLAQIVSAPWFEVRVGSRGALNFKAAGAG